MPQRPSFSAGTAAPLPDALALRLIQQSADGIFLLTPQLRVQLWNGPLEQLSGISAESAENRLLTEIFAPLSELAAALANTVSGSSDQILDEVWLPGAAGRCTLSLAPLRDPAQRLTGILGTIKPAVPGARPGAPAGSVPAPELHRLLAMGSPFIMAVLDLPKREVTYSNRNLLLHLCYRPEELPGFGPDPLAALLHPEDQARLPMRLQLIHSAAEGEVLTFSLRLRHKKRGWIWYQAQLRVTSRDAQLRAREVLCHLQETDEARRNKTLLRGLLENSLLGILAFRVDPDGPGFTCLLCNRPAETMLGLKARQLTGQSLDLLPEPIRAEWQGRFAEVAATGKPQHFAMLLPQAAGTRHLEASVARIEEGLTVTLADVTARVQAAAELQESRQFREHILEASPFLISVHNLPGGDVAFTNRLVTDLTGFTQEELAAFGTGITRHLVHPDDLPLLYGNRERVHQAADGEVIGQTFRLRHKQGHWRWLTSYTAIFRRGPDGTPLQVINFIQDINEVNQQKELLSQVLGNSPIGVMVLQAVRSAEGEVTDFRFRLLNARAGHLLSHPAGDLSGRLLSEAAGTKTASYVSHLAAVLRIGITLELPLLHPHHSARFWFKVGVARLNEDEVVITLTDMTEQRQALAQVRENNLLLREAQSNARFGIWEWDAQTGSLICSDMLFELLGQEPQARPVTQEQLFARVEAPDRARLQDAMREAFRSRQLFALEISLSRPGQPDGRLLWRGQVDQAEHPTRLLGIGMDITETVAFREELVRLEYMQSLGDSVPHLLGTFTLSGEAEYLNRQWQLFAPPTEAPFSWAGLVHPDEQPAFLRKWEQMLASGNSLDLELRLRNRKNSYRWHLLRAVQGHDAGGRPNHWFVSATNIHEQKQLQLQLIEMQQSLAQSNLTLELRNEQLNQSSIDLDRFIRTASHNLREPLNNLRDLLQMAAQPLEAATFSTTLKMAQLSVTQLESTLADLRQLSLLKLATLEPPEPIGLAILLEELRETMQSRLQVHQVALHYDLAVPRILFPRNHIWNILFTLVSNAIMFRAPDRDPEIRIESVQVSEEEVLLRITDNGLGLTARQLQHELSPLARTATAGKSGSRGLHVIRQLMESSGGRLEAKSEPGEGTTIALYLKAGRY